MKQIVFIHGGSDFRSYEEFISYIKNEPVKISSFQIKKRWKQTLDQDLGEDYQVFTPEMPNKQNAHYEEWKIWFERLIPFLQNDVILVGHSLGGIFLAKYLSENTFPVAIKATILISAPYDDTNLEPPLGDFKLTSPLDKLGEQGGGIHLLHAKDDPVVPFSHSESYHNILPNSNLILLESGGHFLEPQFPELINLIKSL